ncbi:MAG: MFS transporter [Actinomycetota bacterium]|nr:MFS transporter [Actinomycetota bacterium]
MPSPDEPHTVEGVTVTPPNVVRRAVSAAGIGNVTEWYDFGVYAYLESVIQVVFLPPDTPGGPVITAALFAASFVVRPFGGLFFGPLADRIGRTKTLAATMILMALATFGIGVLPTYQSIGLAAPLLLLLCRLLQGFSTGGEYAGAMTFVAEYSPDRRRGFLGSFLEVGTLTGYLLGALVVTILQTTLGENSPEMLSWGWRIPFLIALPMGIIGLYLRYRLEETPAFSRLTRDGDGRQQQQGFREFFRVAAGYGWRPVLVCLGLVIAFNITNYMLTTVVPTYLTETLGQHGAPTISTTASQVLQIITLAVLMAIVPFLGRFSDRVGRRPIVVTGCVLLLVLSLPSILLLQSGSFTGVLAGLILLGLMLVCFNSTMPSTLPALFQTGVRYGTLAIAFNVAVSVFGGTTELVIEGLIAATGLLVMPAFYLMLAGVVGLVAVYFLRESNARPLPGSDPAASSDEEAREMVRSSR